MQTLRLVTLAAAAALSAACTTIEPRSAQALADALPPDVVQHRFRVEVPLNTAYRNTLLRARECWQQSPTQLFGNSAHIVEADPYAADLGYARIALRGPSGVLLAVATLWPQGAAATEIVAKSPKFAGATQLGESDTPQLGKWAAGQPVPCQLRFAF